MPADGGDERPEPWQPRAVLLLRLLSEARPLRVFAALALGQHRATDIAKASALTVPQAVRVLLRLERMGLAVRAGDGWRPLPEALAEAARAPGEPLRHQLDEADLPDEARPFFAQGRLLGVPAQYEKRIIVLDQIARIFEPGVRYSEAEVVHRLTELHDDHTALLHSLVDAGFISTSEGQYWRSGGTFDV
jgi:hypothetical protein